MKLRYPAGRQAFGEGRIDWTKTAIVAYLVDGGYKASPKHRTVTDLAGVIQGPVEVTGRSIEDGYAKSERIRFAGVRGERPASAVVIAKRDAALIAYSDEVANFPVQPNGGDIDVKFDPFIFRL